MFCEKNFEIKVEKDVFKKYHHLIRIQQQICHLSRFWKKTLVLFRKNPSIFSKKPQILYVFEKSYYFIRLILRETCYNLVIIFQSQNGPGNWLVNIEKDALCWVDNFLPYYKFGRKRIKQKLLEEVIPNWQFGAESIPQTLQEQDAWKAVILEQPLLQSHEIRLISFH